MSLGISQQISPWQEHEYNHLNFYSIQYEQRKDMLVKKISQQLDNKISTRKKSKKYSKSHILQIDHQHKSVVNCNLKQYMGIDDISKQSILFKTQKLKTEFKHLHSKLLRDFSNHKSCIIQNKNQKQKQMPRISDFRVKKMMRNNQIYKNSSKQKRLDQIFKKMCEIQNPTNRQNISMPKIHIKI